ncbi:MAG: FKBP-type peptidyl-prolyl cis-trans isomerase [Bacteroidota bacterium]
MRSLRVVSLLALPALALLLAGCDSSEDDPTIEQPEFSINEIAVGEGMALADSLTAVIEISIEGLDGTNYGSTSGGDPIPLTLGFGCTIEGIERGLMGMRPGGRREIIMPADLAYGAFSSPDGRIPANTPLRVDVEVIDVRRDFLLEDTEIGTGDEVFSGALLSVSYVGRFLDGREFDSTVGAAPIQFLYQRNSTIIPGWNKGFTGMRAGGRRTLTIPPHLAYGANGSGNGVIPPNTTIVFDVQVVGVQ